VLLELVLIGSSPDMYWISEAEEFLDRKKGFALWWSYPIREEFQLILNQRGTKKIKLYIYNKGSIEYLFLCDDFVTQPGNMGILSPWSEYTSEDEVGKRRLRKTNDGIFKTWFLSTQMTEVNKTLDDFEYYDSGERIHPSSLKNSFVYAKEKYSTTSEGDESNESVFTDLESFSSGVEEGKKILIQHLVRERNQRIIELAKRLRISQYGELKCEVCGFSFGKQYGDRGEKFIEGHHKKPLATRDSSESTRVEDIALVCSNCHRMFHAKMDDLSIENLRNMIKYELCLD
jgi:predicted HNH restriction endonuclease